MKSALPHLTTIPMILFFVGCAHDGLAKRCSKTDWYHRAYDQARLGLPLRDGGELLRACQNRGPSDRYFAESARGTADGEAKFKQGTTAP
jgi:hypothetical protein